MDQNAEISLCIQVDHTRLYFSLFIFSYIYASSIVSVDEKVLVFVGATDYNDGKDGTVAKFENGEWSRVGELIQSRALHNSVVIGDKVIIAGGLALDDEAVDTEVWDIDQSESTLINHSLHHYMAYPALFPVSDDFCSTL